MKMNLQMHWKSWAITDAGIKGCPRIATDVEWKQPKRAAVCAVCGRTVELGPNSFPAQKIMSPIGLDIKLQDYTAEFKFCLRVIVYLLWPSYSIQNKNAYIDNLFSFYFTGAHS